MHCWLSDRVKMHAELLPSQADQKEHSAHSKNPKKEFGLQSAHLGPFLFRDLLEGCSYQLNLVVVFCRGA